VKVANEPEAFWAALKHSAYHFKRIGLEAGPLSQWLFSAIAEAGLLIGEGFCPRGKVAAVSLLDDLNLLTCA
jgi:hypothetical protein